MTGLTRLRAYLTEYRLRRQRWWTERMIEELPSEIRKDIGWPGFYPEDRERHSRCL